MLTGISLVNWLTHRHVDLELGPLTVIAGPNGAGKSSIGDGIAFALAGELRRVEMKGERKMLLSEGAEEGRVILRGPDGTLIRDIATGRIIQPAPILPDKLAPGLLDVLLAPGSFARMAADDRRRLLFVLSDVSLTIESVREMLIERGHAEAKSLPTAGTIATWHETAKSWASEARGRWKGVTGETYGALKAETWQPVVPEGQPPDQRELQEQVQLLEAAIAKANQELGALTAAANADPPISEEERATLEARAAKLDAWVPAHGNAHDAMLAARREVKAAEDALKALSSSADAPEPLHCPECGAVLMLDPEGRGQHLVAHAVTGNDPIELAQRRRRAEAALAEARERQREADEAFYIAQRRLTEAQEAKFKLDRLAAAPRMDVPAGNIEEVRQQIADHQKALAAARTDLEAAAKHAAAVAQAQKKAASAAAAHKEVKAWTAIAEALAPDGIQAEVLAKALGPFRDVLTDLSARSGWAPVTLGGDMAIAAGGRPYGLLSESERWRADAILALAVARVAHVGLVVLDRFDVLDLPSRGRAMRFLYDLTRAGDWSVLVLGTFKAPPQLPPGIVVHWLGEPVAVEKAA